MKLSEERNMADNEKHSGYGCIFNIQRFSLHDGPGIRTVVFLKGCPLSCRWCSNPESQNPQPEILYLASRCIGCYACVGACAYMKKLSKYGNSAAYVSFRGVNSSGSWKMGFVLRNSIPCSEKPALSITSSGVRMDRSLCTMCGECVEVCNTNALSLCGELMHVGEVIEQVERDLVFYRHSGGGLTLSGGEPLFQPEFSLSLIRQAKQKGIHTAIETSGEGAFDILGELASETDLVLFDIKHMDPRKHREWTGVHNEDILKNAKHIAQYDTRVIIRVPVIPFFNNTEKEILDIADFAVSIGVPELELLPYHTYGNTKYESLGRKNDMSNVKPVKREQLFSFQKRLEANGTIVRVIGE